MSLRLYSWFLGTTTLLLKKSVSKCSYVPTWNGGASKRGIKQTAKFQPSAILVTIVTPKPEVGGAQMFQKVLCSDWRIAIPAFKPVAITTLKLCIVKYQNSVTPRKCPLFLNPVTNICKWCNHGICEQCISPMQWTSPASHDFSEYNIEEPRRAWTKGYRSTCTVFIRIEAALQIVAAPE